MHTSLPCDFITLDDLAQCPLNTQSPQAAPNFKSNEKEYDPRSTWKESGESLSAEIKKANPSARAAIPDAITQTDNSAKRSQNAQMRQRQVVHPSSLSLRAM